MNGFCKKDDPPDGMPRPTIPSPLKPDMNNTLAAGCRRTTASARAVALIPGTITSARRSWVSAGWRSQTSIASDPFPASRTV